MPNTKTYTNEEILNKGSYVKFANLEYFCYNKTENLMHFVKLNKNGSLGSFKSKNNLLNLSKNRILSLINQKAAFITVGNIK